jgi:hypothetical protein
MAAAPINARMFQTFIAAALAAGHITLDDPLGTDTFANGINND